MLEDHLDSWLGSPAIRAHHRRTARVGPDELWDAARSVRLDDTRTLGRMVRWRIPGTATDQTFEELFRGYPFTLLEEGPTHSVSGLAGRIWTFDRDYPRLEDPEDYRRWSRPCTVRVLFAHWVEPDGPEGARLHSETRVQPTDRAAAIRLRGLWAVIGVFERLVGAEALSAAVRHASTPARSRARAPR